MHGTDALSDSVTMVTGARLPFQLSKSARIYAYRKADLPECYAIVVDRSGIGPRSVSSVVVYHQDRRTDVLNAAFGAESFLTTAVKAINDHGGILLVYPDLPDEQDRVALPTPLQLLRRLTVAADLCERSS